MIDASRAAAVVIEARRKLRPLAEEPKPSGKWLNDYCSKNGALEGVGLLLRFAAIELEDVDALSEAGMSRFHSEMAAVIEQLQQVTLNFSVLSSLFLTIFVALAVQHAGSAAYYDNGTRESPFIDKQEDWDDYGAWSDLATYAWPHDTMAQRKLRRALYIGECVVLFAGIFVCLAALIQQLLVFTMYGASLPTLVVKAEFIMAKLTRLTDVWYYFDVMVILIVPLSVAFVCARSSAIAGLCGFGLTGLMIVYAAVNGTVRGTCVDVLFCQYREARGLLADGFLETDAQRLWRPPTAGQGGAQ